MIARDGSITFWAWLGSIIVHIFILVIFAAIHFSRTETQNVSQPAPFAKISQIKKITSAEPVIAKPKVKKIIAESSVIAHSDFLSSKSDYKIRRPEPQYSQKNIISPVVKQNMLSVSDNLLLPQKVEFFGSSTSERKICFVVDCSGSMWGIFKSVKQKLKESIDSLEADHFFSIIFFGDDKLIEFQNGKMVRAAEKNKSLAFDFIDSITPAGKTNAMQALEKALEIRDNTGIAPPIIYFLTDGFELTDNTANVTSRIKKLLIEFAPQTKINTIGFWPQENDRIILQMVAVQSNGEAIFIE